MPLSDKDVGVFQRAALELHEARDLDGLRAAAPAVFRRAIPLDYFVWFEAGGGGGASDGPDCVVWDDPARATPEHVERLRATMDEHPFTRHMLRTGDLGPMRLSDFWTREQQLASDIHQRAYRHLGMGRVMAVVLMRARRAGTIILSRPLAARDFSERDRAMLSLLAPHFAQALQAAELHGAAAADEPDALHRLGLTSREAEVALWMARGRTSVEIATILSMRARTVEKHLQNVFLKLGVENRTKAARVILGRAPVGRRMDPPLAAAASTFVRLARAPRRRRRPRT